MMDTIVSAVWRDRFLAWQALARPPGFVINAVIAIQEAGFF